jgi:hypothetical protein
MNWGFLTVCNIAIKYLNVFLLSIFNFKAFFLQTIFSFVRLCVHIWMNCIHKTVRKHLIVHTMRIPTYNWTSNFTCRKWYNDSKYFLFILKGYPVVENMKSELSLEEWFSECCLTLTQQLFSYIMARAS